MLKGGIDIVSLFILGTVVSLIFVITIVAFVMYYYKRLFIHNEELRTKELEKERDLLLALMQGREHEQRRLAEELHDGLAVDITVIKQQVYILRKQLGENKDHEEQLNSIKEMLVAVGENMRAMSHNLTPANIEKFGLVNTISDMIAHINRSGEIKAELHAPVELLNDIPKDMQLMVYRIVQELVQNIHKHAEASLLVISINQVNDRAEITVADNGKGLPENISNENFGIGLRNIQGRAELLNGNFSIKRNIPNGTIAVLSFAYKPI